MKGSRHVIQSESHGFWQTEVAHEPRFVDQLCDARSYRRLADAKRQLHKIKRKHAEDYGITGLSIRAIDVTYTLATEN